MIWQAVAKSVIGTKHIRSKKPCQDYSGYKLEKNNEVMLGAISDGMGSALYSDRGSQLAVSFSLNYLQRSRVWDLEPDKQNRDYFSIFFKNLLIDIRQELAEFARKSRCFIRDLDCTLIVFVATPNWLAAMQVGDGLLVIRSQNYSDYQLVFKPDKGEYANETTSVTSTSAEKEMLSRLIIEPIDFICAATDGVENIALLKRQTWVPFAGFFSGLEQIMTLENTLHEKEEDIEEFLDGDRINTKTDDDKTLLLCRYSDFNIKPEPSKGPEEPQETTTRSGASKSKNLRLIKTLRVSFLFNVILVVVLIITVITSLRENQNLFVYPIRQKGYANPVAYLLQSSQASRLDAWVLAPRSFLDTTTQSLTIPQNETVRLYDSTLDTSKISIIDEPIGFLKSGTYEYSDPKNVAEDENLRWIKISLENR